MSDLELRMKCALIIMLKANSYNQVLFGSTKRRSLHRHQELASMDLQTVDQYVLANFPKVKLD